MSTQKMHIDEVDTNEDLVRRLVSTQFPQWADLIVKTIHSSGTDNALYRLGENMVVRLPRTLSASKQGDKEQQWLPKLAPFLPLTIPKPIVAGIAGEGYPWHWFIFHWLPGQDATIHTVIDEQEAARALAAFLVALWSIDSTDGPTPGEHNFFRGEPLILRDSETRTAITDLSHIFDASIMLQIWNDALEAAAWNQAPCWIHGDLSPTNLLVHQGRLSAVIDFGGLGIGDPACDLIVAWAFLSENTRETFRLQLLVDNATWTRGKGWALAVGLSAFGYYHKTNPVVTCIAKRAVEEVLADFKANKQKI